MQARSAHSKTMCFWKVCHRHCRVPCSLMCFSVYQPTAPLLYPQGQGMQDCSPSILLKCWSRAWPASRCRNQHWRGSQPPGQIEINSRGKHCQ